MGCVVTTQINMFVSGAFNHGTNQPALFSILSTYHGTSNPIERQVLARKRIVNDSKKVETLYNMPVRVLVWSGRYLYEEIQGKMICVSHGYAMSYIALIICRVKRSNVQQSQTSSSNTGSALTAMSWHGQKAPTNSIDNPK
ncbi:hypothetical protein LguiA_023689 [Lonicera macranthoides]